MDAPIRLPERLTDGLIVLNSPTIEDAEAHWRGEDDEMRRRFDWPLMRRVTLEHVRRVMAQWISARAAGGPMFVYAIRDGSGLMMGGCELRRLGGGSLNVSWWLFPDFRGRGYATRALALLCVAARGIDGALRLEASIDPANQASRRLAERLAFTETGAIPDETMASGSRIVFVLPLDPA
jgi:RimJ/RimL family protein N-acetyltransferase